MHSLVPLLVALIALSVVECGGNFNGTWKLDRGNSDSSYDLLVAIGMSSFRGGMASRLDISDTYLISSDRLYSSRNALHGYHNALFIWSGGWYRGPYPRDWFTSHSLWRGSNYLQLCASIRWCTLSLGKEYHCTKSDAGPYEFYTRFTLCFVSTMLCTSIKLNLFFII